MAGAAAGAALAGVASARQGQGNNSSSAAVAVHNVKDMQEQLLQLPPPPPPPPPGEDERKSGKKATGPTMSEVMLAGQDGVALITRDLTIVDANMAFMSLLVGASEASSAPAGDGAVGSKDPNETSDAMAKAQGDLVAGKQKADLAPRRRNVASVSSAGGGGKERDLRGAGRQKLMRPAVGNGALAVSAAEGGGEQPPRAGFLALWVLRAVGHTWRKGQQQQQQQQQQQ